MVPNTRMPEKPSLFSSLPRKVSSNTPTCETSAVSLMKPMAKAAAGGRMTGQDCGTITLTSVCQRLKFMAAAASVCWRATDSKPPRMMSAV